MGGGAGAAVVVGAVVAGAAVVVGAVVLGTLSSMGSTEVARTGPSERAADATPAPMTAATSVRTRKWTGRTGTVSVPSMVSRMRSR